MTDKSGNQDSQVVEQVLAGNRDGFRELVERYQSRIFGLTLRLVGNPTEAEDLTQQSFVEAFRGLRSYDSRRSFATWLTCIALNNCKDHLKSHKRRERQLVGEVDGTGALFTGRLPAADQLVTALERAELVNAALLRIDPKYRVPLVLKDVEGWSYNEIQQELDLPVTTLKIRVVRARVKLQEQLRPWLSPREKKKTGTS